MPRPVRATIDLGALRHNLAIAQRAAGNASLLAVVKANAYGHGLERVLPALQAADGLALVELERAVALRESGYRKPILMLGGFYESCDVEVFAQQRLAAVVHDEEQILMLEAARNVMPIDVFLKVNTGMNRLGFEPARVEAAIRRLRASGKLGALTLMTHFANADDARGVDWQLAALPDGALGKHWPRSMANSAALLRYPAARGDWVRPGIMLYGSSPFAEISAAELGLRPVMTLETRIVAVQRLRPGDRVGYGGTFTAQEPMRIGVIACGYADGYPRHAPSGTPVLVAGRLSRTVGLVSMDLICVDLTRMPQAGVGSRVVLWGEGMPVDEIARSAKTVSYELLCALSARVPVTVMESP
ncbi:MAG TPA: alanine racemase [Burkholderiales bacterium]|nr:alanine racemase [Burkholderiales bacterium]